MNPMVRLFDVSPVGAIVNAMEANQEGLKRDQKARATKAARPSFFKSRSFLLIPIFSQIGALITGRGA